MGSRMYKTPFREVSGGSSSDSTFVNAEFGLSHLKGNARPYMSLTGAEYSQPRALDRFMLSCGAMHDRIIEVFPELKEVEAWHLASDGEPMHYMANARFWWEIANCVRAGHAGDFEKAPANFKSTIALGVLPEDVELDGLLDKEWPEVQLALAARLPAMRKAFNSLSYRLPDIARAIGAKRMEERHG